MQTIWKYRLGVEGKKAFTNIPWPAHPLSVGLDQITGEPVVWVKVSDDNTPSYGVGLAFRYFGTGHSLDADPEEGWDFLGTASGHILRADSSTGPFLAWHVFYMREKYEA